MSTSTKENEGADSAPKPATTAAPPPKPTSKEIMLTADFGQVYCRANPDGTIMRPIKTVMRLWDKLGHFYPVYDSKAGKGKPAPEDDEGDGQDAPRPRGKVEKYRYSLTVSGYRQLNKTAAITTLTPQSIVVGGEVRNNPYVERAGTTKAITGVAVRKIGIGYAASGSVVVIDKYLFYNPYTYFIQSIQAKMKEKWWSGPLQDQPKNPNAALYGQVDENPGKFTQDPRPGRWVFFLVEAPLGLWINYDDPAILDCLSEHTQRQRFGDRIAQTIVERNIYKDHPAIGVTQVIAKDWQAGGKFADVTLYGWRHDLAPSHLADILKQAESGTGTEGFEMRRSEDSEVDLEAERDAMGETVDGEAEREAIHEVAPNGATKVNPVAEKEPTKTTAPPADGTLFPGAKTGK